MLLQKIREVILKYRKDKAEKHLQDKLRNYDVNGKVAWSEGYAEYKIEEIKKAICNPNILHAFLNKKVPADFGVGLDERITEYSWIFANLKREKTKFLDAGSTFNFQYLIENPIIKKKEITIYTYYPESPNFNENKISYNYGDLRDICYKDNIFEEIVCQSTIEHIDMDNSMYGYALKGTENIQNKSYEYLKVIIELLRVLKSQGQLLLTFPYGKFENHNFFQQLDNEMLLKIYNILQIHGTFDSNFFLYTINGWKYSTQTECNDAESYNPHTGRGKKFDNAAHCRGICCIKFVKI